VPGSQDSAGKTPIRWILPSKVYTMRVGEYQHQDKQWCGLSP
jgi:hypothetical protein